MASETVPTVSGASQNSTGIGGDSRRPGRGVSAPIRQFCCLRLAVLSPVNTFPGSLPFVGNSKSCVRRKKPAPLVVLSRALIFSKVAGEFGTNFSPKGKILFLYCRLNHRKQKKAGTKPTSKCRPHLSQKAAERTTTRFLHSFQLRRCFDVVRRGKE